MQKWVADGLVVGLITVAVGGGVSILMPRNSGAALVGSGLGAVVSSTILAKGRSRVLAALEIQLQDAQASLVATQAEASVAQADVSELLEQFDREQEKQLEENFPIQQPDEATTSSPVIDKEVVNSTDLKSQSEAMIITWLSTKRISVEDRRNLDPHVGEIFNKQAIYLGSNLKDKNRKPLLAPFLKQIKWAISENRGVKYHLKNSTQLQTRILTQFCRSLHDDTLLSSYYYSKDEKIIHGAIQDRGDVRSFFNGEWFERFINSVIVERASYSSIGNRRMLKIFLNSSRQFL